MTITFDSVAGGLTGVMMLPGPAGIEFIEEIKKDSTQNTIMISEIKLSIQKCEQQLILCEQLKKQLMQYEAMPMIAMEFERQNQIEQYWLKSRDDYQLLFSQCSKILDKYDSAKRSVSYSISLYKQTEDIIRFIKENALELNINSNSLERVFDPVFEAFPNRKAIVNQLAKIVNQYGISEKFLHKEFNKLDNDLLSHLKTVKWLESSKLVEFTLNIIEELDESKSYNDPAVSISFFRDFFIELKSLNESLKHFILIDPISKGQRIFEMFLKHYNIVKEDPYAKEYLKKITKIFSKHGINISEENPKKGFEQFQSAINKDKLSVNVTFEPNQSEEKLWASYGDAKPQLQRHGIFSAPTPGPRKDLLLFYFRNSPQFCDQKLKEYANEFFIEFKRLMDEVAADSYSSDLIEVKRKEAAKLIKQKISTILRELFKEWWLKNKLENEHTAITRENIPSEMNDAFLLIRSEILDKVDGIITNLESSVDHVIRPTY